MDECSENLDDCHANATCNDLPGLPGFECACNTGYSGSGTECSDVDECTGTNDCDVNADCGNIDGSYTCTCKEGYIGDGNECIEIGKYNSELSQTGTECEKDIPPGMGNRNRRKPDQPPGTARILSG